DKVAHYTNLGFCRDKRNKSIRDLLPFNFLFYLIGFRFDINFGRYLLFLLTVIAQTSCRTTRWSRNRIDIVIVIVIVIHDATSTPIKLALSIEQVFFGGRPVLRAPNETRQYLVLLRHQTERIYLLIDALYRDVINNLSILKLYLDTRSPIVEHFGDSACFLIDRK